MTLASDLVLQGLIEKFAPKDKARLLAMLPHGKELKMLPTSSIPSPQVPLTSFIHYSWFLPVLQAYSPEEASCFLPLFSEKSAKQIRQLLNLPEGPKELSLLIAAFLNELLLASLQDKDLVPIEFLPQDPLSSLALLDKEAILKIISLLPIFDLALMLPKIIDKSLLNTINSHLMPLQRAFLQTLKAKNLAPVFADLPLGSAMNAKEFHSQMQKRGLITLRLTLSASHPCLVWYIAHILDIGRGNLLLQLPQKEIPSATRQMLVAEVQTALSFVKNWQE